MPFEIIGLNSRRENTPSQIDPFPKTPLGNKEPRLSSKPSPLTKSSSGHPILLPKLGSGPLQLNFAPSAISTIHPGALSSPANATSTPPLHALAQHHQQSNESTHTLIQTTWSSFSSMSDSQRNQLLKGLISRSSTRQIEMICTCLNLKSLNLGTPSHPVPTKIVPDDLAFKYPVSKMKRKPKSKEDQGEKTIQGDRIGQSDMHDAFLSGKDSGTLNPNIYIKLLNNNMNPDLISKQMDHANRDGAKFLVNFLSSRCKRLQGVLQCMYDIALEIDPEKAMTSLQETILSATEGKYATFYGCIPNQAGKLNIQISNWPNQREAVHVDQVFAGQQIMKGDVINVYNVKTSEHYVERIDDAYNAVEPECILSAPIYGDGMRVSGLIEVVNKDSGNPFFNAEDEFMIKALASLGTLLYNHANIKQSAIKKTDDIKSFLSTASAMTTDMDMGDLIQVIMQTAKELVGGERCALFMLDREKEELWSKVAQGASEIRIPMTKGIAGHVAMTGEVLNIPDAYADSRFNRAVDMKTGFRTRNILCMPMFNQDGQVIGVTQVINKMPVGSYFTKEDELQLSSFSALAASTIEKSMAFLDLHASLQEMNRSRAFMASMIQTMNSVVMCLNDNGRLVYINDTERFGIHGNIQTMRLTSFEHWLGHDNSDLVEDIHRAQTAEELVIGRNYTVTFGQGNSRFVNYYVKRLGYNEAMDRLFEEKKEAKSSIAKSSVVKEETNMKPPSISGLLLCFEEITAESNLVESLSRQMNPSTVRKLIGDPPKIFGDQQRVTCLVADVRSFTSLTEHLAPSKTVSYLNHFYELVTNAVLAEGGVVTKYSGDSVTAVFGIPYYHMDDSFKAVSAALRIRQGAEELNKKHEAVEMPGIKVGVGIATGVVVCGVFGTARSREYNIVGEPVNVASLLEETAKEYGCPILLDERTKEEVKERFHLREVDMVILRGKQDSNSLFEVMGSTEIDLHHDIMTTLICFELGLTEYRGKNWQAAIMHFRKAMTLSDDRPSKTFIDRCKSLIDGKVNVPEEWDGVWRLISQ